MACRGKQGGAGVGGRLKQSEADGLQRGHCTQPIRIQRTSQQQGVLGLSGKPVSAAQDKQHACPHVWLHGPYSG